MTDDSDPLHLTAGQMSYLKKYGYFKTRQKMCPSCRSGSRITYHLSSTGFLDWSCSHCGFRDVIK